MDSSVSDKFNQTHSQLFYIVLICGKAIKRRKWEKIQIGIKKYCYVYSILEQKRN